jgi:hypothetical protein
MSNLRTRIDRLEQRAGVGRYRPAVVLWDWKPGDSVPTDRPIYILDWAEAAPCEVPAPRPAPEPAPLRVTPDPVPTPKPPPEPARYAVSPKSEARQSHADALRAFMKGLASGQ